jgi:radical SAM protein with 4Fe4S-binding SPASM domain
MPAWARVAMARSAVAATAARAAELGAGEIQLLRYKPAGRADGADYEGRRLDPGQVRALWGAVEQLVAAKRLRVRIDCAMVPLLSESLLEAFHDGGDPHTPATGVPDAAGALAKLGVFGCEAARHLGALTVGGEVAACSFFSLAQPQPVALRTRSRGLATTWDGEPALARLRAYHAAPPEPCRSCPLFSVCRGGCQIVSRAAGGSFSPDPECPRVVRSAARP